MPADTQVKAQGADIRFAKMDGTHLAYQIERWVDGVNDKDTADIWVKIDTVFGNSDAQFINMYWGKSDAVDSSNSGNVFATGNGFVGVWHLNTTGTGSRPDATSNGLSATTNNYNSSVSKPGYIGNSDSLNGSNQYLSLPSGMSNWSNGITYYCWAYPTSSGSAARFMDFGNGQQSDNIIFSRNGTSSNLCVQVLNGSDYGGQIIENTGALVNNQWGHYAFTVNGTCVKIYKNGVYVGGGTSTQTINNITRNNNWFGRSAWECAPYNDAYYKGKYDEIVLSNVERSADWIKLCYENQKQNQAFATIKDVSTFYLTDDGRGTRIQKNQVQVDFSGNSFWLKK